MSSSRVLFFSFLLVLLTSKAFGQKEVIVSNIGSRQIESYIVSGDSVSTQTISFDTSTFILALLWDENRQDLLWLDTKQKKFKKKKLGELDPEKLDIDSLGNPLDLKIDWAKKDVYWIDGESKRIYTAKFKGNKRTEIETDSLIHPTGLALSLQEGYLFWSDIALGIIGGLSLDGSDQWIVASNLPSPVRMEIDPLEKHLYWTDDEEHRVYRSDFLGQHIEVIYQGAEKEHPFGLYLDQMDRRLYWTDYGTDRVLSSNLDGSEVKEVLKADLKDPVGIVVRNTIPALGFRSEEGPQANEMPVLYPNPTDGYTTLQLPPSETDCHFYLYDAKGQLVREGRITSHVYRLDVRDIPNGYYLYQVKSEQNLYRGKLIVAK